jgi:hypothetical protein
MSLRSTLNPATRGPQAETVRALQEACRLAGRNIQEVAAVLGKSIDAAADELWRRCEARRLAADEATRRAAADDDQAWQESFLLPVLRALNA